eukprot:EG_transcript_11264
MARVWGSLLFDAATEGKAWPRASRGRRWDAALLVALTALLFSWLCLGLHCFASADDSERQPAAFFTGIWTLPQVGVLTRRTLARGPSWPPQSHSTELYRSSGPPVAATNGAPSSGTAAASMPPTSTSAGLSTVVHSQRTATTEWWQCWGALGVGIAAALGVGLLGVRRPPPPGKEEEPALANCLEPLMRVVEECPCSDPSSAASPPPAVVVRRLQPDEVAPLAELVTRCFALPPPAEGAAAEDFFDAALRAAELEALKRDIAARQLDGGWICVVAERQGRLIACAEAVVRPRGGERLLQNVAVAPEERGCGHGRAVVEAVEQHCPERCLAAEVWQDDAQARRFWTALGYRLEALFYLPEDAGAPPGARLAGRYVKCRPRPQLRLARPSPAGPAPLP